MKILYLIRKKKKSYVEVAKIYGKNTFFYPYNCKEGKEKFVLILLLVASQMAKVVATVCDKCLVTMKKVLNLWVEDMNRNSI